MPRAGPREATLSASLRDSGAQPALPGLCPIAPPAATRVATFSSSAPCHGCASGPVGAHTRRPSLPLAAAAKKTRRRLGALPRPPPQSRQVQGPLANKPSPGSLSLSAVLVVWAGAKGVRPKAYHHRRPCTSTHYSYPTSHGGEHPRLSFPLSPPTPASKYSFFFAICLGRRPPFRSRPHGARLRTRHGLTSGARAPGPTGLQVSRL